MVVGFRRMAALAATARRSAIAAIATVNVGRSTLGRRRTSDPGARRLQPGHGALDDQLALSPREGGEDAEHEAAVSRGGVDLRAGAGQHLEPDAARPQVLDDVDRVAQVAAEPVQLSGGGDGAGLAVVAYGPGLELAGFGDRLVDRVGQAPRRRQAGQRHEAANCQR